MGIYLGANALGGGGGAGGGATLEGAKAYRTLIIGGGANGVLGATYGAGGGGAGAFIETAVPFMTGITYNITVAGGGGTTTIDSANGIYTASAGGEGRRALSGLTGASGGGGGGSQVGGPNHITDYKGTVLGSMATSQVINSSITLYGTDVFPNGIITGRPGGSVLGSNAYWGGGGGGAGAPGQSNVQHGAGGVGLSTNIITVATATSASVGDVQNGSDVYFSGGGYGGRLTTVNTTVLGTGTNTGGGGQSSSVAGGVSSGDSGCVIIKVPAGTDFTQAGATAYTDQGMTAIIWAGSGTLQIN